MLNEHLWPAERQFHELLTKELKAKIHDRFGDHEFDKKIAAVRELAQTCWRAVLKSRLVSMDDILDDASFVVYTAMLNTVKVHVEPHSRKKTISIGLR